VDVLEELEATVAIWCLEHGDLGVVAVEADGGVGPLATDSVTAEDGQSEVGEEGDRRFNPNIVQLAAGDLVVRRMLGLGPGRVVGAFDVPFGHLALDDSRRCSWPADGVEST
jgi:hypothetical protein